MFGCKGVFKGGGGGSNPLPPKIFRFFLKSEGKAIERKRKQKGCCGGGGLPRGVCRISQGGPTLKKLGFGYTCREAACREQRSCEPLLGGFWGMPPPKNIFKNGAISCVLRAIFNHFHGKKSSQKKYK